MFGYDKILLHPIPLGQSLGLQCQVSTTVEPPTKGSIKRDHDTHFQIVKPDNLSICSRHKKRSHQWNDPLRLLEYDLEFFRAFSGDIWIYRDK